MLTTNGNACPQCGGDMQRGVRTVSPTLVDRSLRLKGGGEITPAPRTEPVETCTKCSYFRVLLCD